MDNNHKVNTHTPFRSPSDKYIYFVQVKWFLFLLTSVSAYGGTKRQYFVCFRLYIVNKERLPHQPNEYNNSEQNNNIRIVFESFEVDIL